ncbi:MAG: hypothetical protein H7Z43_02490, partial [Clostridia bacterium]|nr:hypothetical protein [Deltaproteobacteria bacterium]
MAETQLVKGAEVKIPVTSSTASADDLLSAIRKKASEAGVPEALIQLGRLDAKDPKARTVSHLIGVSGIDPYRPLGHRIANAIDAMNKASTPNFSFNAIRRDFISLDMKRLALISPANQQDAIDRLDRFIASLGGKPVTAPPSDGVELPLSKKVDTTGTPTGLNRLPAIAKQTTVELPLNHPALKGTSPQWQAWLARGDNRVRTMKTLLGEGPKSESFTRPESFKAGLDQVISRYHLGDEGHAGNLEQLCIALQTELTKWTFSPSGWASVPSSRPGQFKV